MRNARRRKSGRQRELVLQEDGEELF